ncbi:MAG: hypothetical protein WDN07_01230 [Actinomycetota bacterium]
MNKTTFRGATLTTVVALTAAVLTPAIAGAATAKYPPTLKKATFTSSTIAIGKSVAPPTTDSFQKNQPKVIDASVNEPVRVLIGGLKVGAVFSASVVGPDNMSVKLPKIVVNKNGTLDTSSLALLKAGKYTFTFKGPGGVTQTVTINVS